MNIYSTVILFCTLSIFSCKSSEMAVEQGAENRMESETNIHKSTNLKQSLKTLAGNWVWIKTDCCGRTTKTTYAQKGDAPKVIAFDVKGNATYFADEHREKTIVEPFTLGTLGEQATIKIGDLTTALFAVQNDTLVLSWGYIDLQTDYYVRTK